MKKRLLASLLAGMLSAGQNAYAASLSGTIFEQVGEDVAIDPLLLYAVALCESGFKPAGSDRARPWPWTLRYPGGALYAESKKDALLELKRLNSLGIDSIDAGLMQINLRWHRKLTEGADIFDPETNLRTGARILKDTLNSAPGNLALGIGRFHTWVNSEKQTEYSLKVLRTYRRLKNQ